MYIDTPIDFLNSRSWVDCVFHYFLIVVDQVGQSCIVTALGYITRIDLIIFNTMVSNVIIGLDHFVFLPYSPWLPFLDCYFNCDGSLLVCEVGVRGLVVERGYVIYSRVIKV